MKRGLKVNLNIAKNHVVSRKKQSIVAAMGVTFGISMYIFMNGLIEGTNDLQETITLSTTPHVRVFVGTEENKQSISAKFFGEPYAVNVRNQSTTPAQQSIHNAGKIIDLLSRDKAVAAVTPQVNVNVFYKVGVSEYSGYISGVDIYEEDRMFDLRSSMVDGKIEDLVNNPNGLIIGIKLAENLNLKVGDNITVSTAEGVMKLMKVVGTFQTTIAAIDKAKSYANLSTTQQLSGKDQSFITEIKVNLKNIDEAETFTQRYASLIDYAMEDWIASNQQLQAASKLRTIILLSVVMTILLVAGFGIYNILNMTIYEKIKDIAILKAMGFSGKDVTQIFLFQAIFIGAVGGLIGLMAGVSISFIVANIPVDLAVRDRLPIEFDAMYYVTGFLFGLVTSTLAGYIPARKAADVDPVEILRG